MDLPIYLPLSCLLPAGILLCPECPRWLVAHGRMEEAQAAAKRLWGGHAAEELAAIASEFEALGLGEGAHSSEDCKWATEATAHRCKRKRAGGGGQHGLGACSDVHACPNVHTTSSSPPEQWDARRAISLPLRYTRN